MKLHKSFVGLVVGSALLVGSANASEDPAAKIDSGVGELPPYAEWHRHPELARLVQAHKVEGEKLDSGLGELPHYREWHRYPNLARSVVEPAPAAIAPTASRATR